MLIALDSIGVFRCEDFGQTWRVSSAGLRNFDVDWIAFSGDYAGDRTAYLYARAGPNMFGFPEQVNSTGLRRRKDLAGHAGQPDGLEIVAVTDAPNTLVAARCRRACAQLWSFSFRTIRYELASSGHVARVPSDGRAFRRASLRKWALASFLDGCVLYRSQDFGVSWSPVRAETSEGVPWGAADTRACIDLGRQGTKGLHHSQGARGAAEL